MAKVYKRKFAHVERWYADFTIRGERYRIKLEAQDKEQAKKMAAEVEYDVLAGNYRFLQNVKPITLQELSDQYMEYAKTKKRSWKRDIVSLKNILNMVIDNKKLGDYPIGTIKVSHIQKYQVLRKKELEQRYSAKGIEEADRNFATCNRELACLRHIFNLGIEWELLSKNPVVSKVVKFDKEKSRERTLEDEEFACLLRTCTGRLLQIMLVALNTGMRVGEILSLKWENVNIDKRKIEIKHTKNGEDRDIPINAFLHTLFESMPRDHVYLFVNRDGKKMGSIKTAWNTVCRKINTKNLRFHDLRHTMALRLARAQVPESVIAMILGHKRASVTSRYINPHWDEMAAAVAILGELCHVSVTRRQKQ